MPEGTSQTSNKQHNEIIRYETTFLAVWDSLNDTIAYIRRQTADRSQPVAKLIELERDLARYEAERRLLEAKRRAFRRGLAQVKVPTRPVIDEARRIAKEIDTAIQNSATAEEVLKTAQTAVALFNRIQPV